MRPGHTNNFNLLRLILANLVLLAHSPELIDGERSREILTRLGFSLSFGELAVAGFFVLSGYLIVQSWVSKPEPMRFLANRIKRIVPAFVVASLLCTFVVGAIGSTKGASYYSQVDVVAYFKSLATLQPPATPPVFPGQPHPSVNGAMWTISYEFRCYMVVLVAGMLTILRRRWLWVGCAVFLLAACLIDQNGFPRWQVSTYRLYLLAYFAAGGCFFLFREKVSYTAPLAALAFVGLLIGLRSKHTEVLALCLPGAYLLLWMAFKNMPALARFNKFPDVSYGAYLYGWPIQKIIVWYVPTISPWMLFPVSVCLAIAAGTVSWFAVERWFMGAKRLPANQGFAPPAHKALTL